MKKYGKLFGLILALTAALSIHAAAGVIDLGGLLDGLGNLGGSLGDVSSLGSLGSSLGDMSSLGNLSNLGSLANAAGTGSQGSAGASDTSSLLDLLLGGGSSDTSQSSSSDNADSSSIAGVGMDLLMNLLGVSNRPMKDCTVAAIKDQTYTGDPIKPVPVVKYNGTRLKKGTDYTATYSNNTKVGTAKITLKGKGNYTGTKTVSFKIVKKNASSSGSTKKETTSKEKSKSSSSSGKEKSGSDTGKASDKSKTKRFTVKTQETSFIYNGKVRKPEVTVTARGKKVPKTEYTVTYKNNKSVGKAAVTVKGKGEYKGYAGETTFKITLKKTSLTGASSGSPGTITCKWNPDSQADGYQIGYATNKTFKNEKTLRVIGGTKKTAELTKLTSGKQYYVRIRSYKKVGSSNWYSEWSVAKPVKVK